MNHEKIIEKLNFVLTHNKTLSKQNYYILDEIKTEIEKDFENLLKESYKKAVFIPLTETDLKYKCFDNLYNLSDKKFLQLKRKAKKLYYNFTHENNFDLENCFISSSSLHGFYFPNLQIINCICFIDEKPILLY